MKWSCVAGKAVYFCRLQVCVLLFQALTPNFSLVPAFTAQTVCRQRRSLTIDQDRCGAALATSHYVLGHTRVVARVCQTGLSDDKIVVGCDEKIGVAGRVDDVLISLPLHLKTCLSGQKIHFIFTETQKHRNTETRGRSCGQRRNYRQLFMLKTE